MQRLGIQVDGPCRGSGDRRGPRLGVRVRRAQSCLPAGDGRGRADRLQKNRYWLRADGLSLDVGPFVAAIEFATSTAACVVGKPAPAFFAEVLADLGAAAAVTAMIGDDIESDIGGALNAGLAAILVRTGKYREPQVRESGIEPTVVVDSIADVPSLLGR